MKKVLSMFIIIITLLNISCSENFVPKAAFDQQYALFSIINGDTSYQYAMVTKSYSVNGFDPKSYTGNTYIPNAEVTISYDGKDYRLRDSVVKQDGNPTYIYYTNELDPGVGDDLSITALLPDGTELKSSTHTPNSDNLSFNVNEVQSDYTIEGKPDGVFLIWRINGRLDARVMFLPQLKIYYLKKENGTTIHLTKEVPVSYFMKENSYLPNYPVVFSGNYITFEKEAVDRAMREISEGDSVKSNYTIQYAQFNLYLLDENLAPYYLSNQTFLDGFTVILDQTDFSNVMGGFGVFGSFFMRQHKLSILPDYIVKFGYKHQ